MKRRNFLKMIPAAGLGYSLSYSLSYSLGYDLGYTLNYPLPRSAMAAVQNKTTGFVYDELFLKHQLTEDHPESPDRLLSIMQTMMQSELLAQLTQLKPESDILTDLARIHNADHIRSIEKNYEQSNSVALAVVGGILAATDEVCSGRLKNAFCATRPPGHHARNTGKVEGFCFYNGVAVAARYAQHHYGLKKILIIDWDYHHGDGTESFFYTDPSVLYFSTHDYYAYPGTGNPDKTGAGAGAGLNINVHLDCHSTDEDIIKAFNEKLLPAAHRFKPDLILISAGFDSRQDDLLGCFDITDEGYRQLTKMVMQLADTYCDGRLVSVLEGGYYLKGLASAVKTHVETLLDN